MDLADFWWAPDEDIYTDGSCIYSSLPEIASAGCAALQMKPDIRTLQYTVPKELPQSAVVSEHVALHFTATRQTKPHKATVMCDCAGVANGHLHELSEQLNHKNAMGGFWADVGDSVKCIHKVKARTTKEESEALGQGHLYKGNNWVDLLAKEAVGRYSESEITGYLKTMDPKKKTLEAFTKRLTDTADSINVHQMGRCSHTPMPGSKIRRRPHSFRWNQELGRYICAECGTWTRSGTRQRAALRTCPGKSRFIDGLHHSHRAWQARLQGETTGIHFCNICGCYAAVRSEGLKAQCKGRTYHATIHRELREGIHPGTEGFLCKPRRVFGPSGQAQQLAVAARPPHVDPGPLPAPVALAGPGTPQDRPLSEFAGFVDDPWHADEQAIRDMESFDEDFHDFLL